jgi:hypothetical protein
LKKSSETFQINAHLIPGTQVVLLDRVEDPGQNKGRKPRDWHLAYHEATMARVFKGSDRTPGCIRAVKYDWAGLEVVCRFDVDGFTPEDGDEVILEEEDDIDDEAEAIDRHETVEEMGVVRDRLEQIDLASVSSMDVCDGEGVPKDTCTPKTSTAAEHFLGQR